MADQPIHTERQPLFGSIASGFAELLGLAGHKPIKRIHLIDPVRAVVKTLFGSMAIAEGKSELTIEFDEAANAILAEAEKIAAQLSGEAEKIAAEASNTGETEEEA